MEIAVLRRTAAHIAAAAMYELYPNIELLEGGETSTGFFYDFYFPHPAHTTVIEAKMKQIVREKREIRTHDMVPLSARELLKSRGLYARAEGLEGDGLVQLIQIGDFFDLSPGPHLKNTFELAAFKVEVESLKEKRVRLRGYCHFSKEGLRTFLKKVKNYIEPEILGQKLGLWREGMLLPKGVEVREKLIQFLKKEWFDDCFEVLGRSVSERMSLHRLAGKPKVGEIWGEGPGVTKVQISFFDKTEGDLNSCLQMVGKTLTILGFDHSKVQRGLWTDFVVEDALERKYTIAQVFRKGASRIDFMVFAGVEEILAQMIEKNLIKAHFEN